jgi:hypothetical protein
MNTDIRIILSLGEAVGGPADEVTDQPDRFARGIRLQQPLSGVGLLDEMKADGRRALTNSWFRDLNALPMTKSRYRTRG